LGKKETIHEGSLEVEGASKAPDYAFRIGETCKFFVEAMKVCFYDVKIRYIIYEIYTHFSN